MQEAEKLLSDFMHTHLSSTLDYTNVPIEETGLLKNVPVDRLELTHFNDLYDTLIYSNLIHKALTLSPGTNQLIDLGAGSSIPTLMAREKGEFRDLATTAVDVDNEAIEISRKNSHKMGFSDSYNFFHGSMSSALEELNIDEKTLVVSNPPYIPVPEGVREHHLVPINGGEDGSEYLEEVLKKCHPYGCTLALLWGSLTSPLKIIPLIGEKFEVLHLESIRIHFGNYTTLPLVKDHLYQLRDEGRVVFDDDESQIVIGTILRPKFHKQ